MEALSRALSRPQAKPYRTQKLGNDGEIHLDENGLLQWSPNDLENPKNWSRARKWYITMVGIGLVTNASMASSSPSGCLPSISDELGVSIEVAKLTVTLFLLGFCSGPSIWAPLSEYFGRRIVFVTTFICYVAFTFLCAFTPNIGGLLVGRFLTGTFISGALSNTPGIFADLWGPIERGNSMTLFSCALQMGPAIGPITSGFYQLKLDWRWNFYQLLWLAAASLLLLPTIPETLPSRALLQKAQRIRRARIPGYENVRAPIEVEGKSLMQIFKTALMRPWAVLIDPIAFLIAIYITVIYTLLYMLFTIFPIAFIDIRGWNAGVGELPLLSVCIGGIFAGVYVFWDSTRQRKRIAAGHKHCAEDTLPVAMVGAISLPIAMFLVAWTGAYASVHWIAPTIGGVILSFAICVLFIAFLSYLSESYLMYAASAQAGNQILRSAVAAGAPLYTQQMFDKLTVGGGGSLIAGIAILLMPIPFVFYKYGARIRVKSKFAPATTTTTTTTTTATPEIGEDVEKCSGEQTTPVHDDDSRESVVEGREHSLSKGREEVEGDWSDRESTRASRDEQRFHESDEMEKGRKS